MPRRQVAPARRVRRLVELRHEGSEDLVDIAHIPPASTPGGPVETGPRMREGLGQTVSVARDRRLGRDVALKVLPAQVAADADRLARLEREAR